MQFEIETKTTKKKEELKKNRWCDAMWCDQAQEKQNKNKKSAVSTFSVCVCLCECAYRFY